MYIRITLLVPICIDSDPLCLWKSPVMFDTTTPMSTAVLHKLDKKWTPEGFFKGLKKRGKNSLWPRVALLY